MIEFRYSYTCDFCGRPNGTETLPNFDPSWHVPKPRKRLYGHEVCFDCSKVVRPALLQKIAELKEQLCRSSTVAEGLSEQEPTSRGSP